MSVQTVFVVFGGILTLYAIYWPSRHATHYSYIENEDIYQELIFSHIENSNPKLKSCDYDNVIQNYTEFSASDVKESKHFYWPKIGGEHTPSNCSSMLKVAVIIPYRNRSEQLKVFVNFMHNFLQNQLLHYRIFVVNQTDNLPFNRAKMLNFGSRIAIDAGYPCLILHDVDLIPLNTGNIYGCTKQPRHMSSSVDTFRFNLPYITLFGGAVSISAKQFQSINGLSNKFDGWGGEDDEFYKRLKIHSLRPCRFSPVLSKYTMLFHFKEKPSSSRWSLLKTNDFSHRIDGLSTLSTNYTVKLERLYTVVSTF